MKYSSAGQPFAARIKRLDFLAPEPKLNIGGRPSVQTYIGACLSVTMALVLTAGWAFIFYDYFRTDTPTVTQQSSYSPNYPDYDLSADKHVPVLTLYFQASVMIKADVAA